MLLAQVAGGMLLMAGSFIIFKMLLAAERADGPGPAATARGGPVLRLVKTRAVSSPEKKAA